MSFVSQARYRVYLCGAKHCTGRGSKELLVELEKQVHDRGLEENIAVMCGGCTQHCAQGPTLCVYPGPIFYSKLSVETLGVIVDKHLTHDQPVKEFFFKDPKQSPQRNNRYR